jgi:hypothetical protein
LPVISCRGIWHGFSRTYPGIKVDLVELPRGAIETGIVDRTLDIAVMLVSNLQNRRDATYETLVYSRRRLWLSVDLSPPTSPAWTLVLSGLRNASRLRRPSCFVNFLASTSAGLRIDGVGNDGTALCEASHPPSFAG